MSDKPDRLEFLASPRPGLFICTRTRLWDERPCSEAFPILITVVDTRYCSSPKEIPINNGTDGDWYLKGTNHRVVDGYIKRDLDPETAWAVELPTLLSLMKFVETHGRCIVGTNKKDFSTIEIYDRYRYRE